MVPLTNFSTAAYLIADHARASMLTALLDGRAWPAGELAYASGVTAQTASSHLAKLLDGGLVLVEKQGRHRYYRLAGPHVAQALEHLAIIQPTATIRRKTPSPLQRQLGFCRCCYNHLAGQLGVAITDALLAKRYLVLRSDGQYAITSSGKQWLALLGIDLRQMKPAPRGLVYPCLDWTERHHHLAGPVAARLLNIFCEKDWLRRVANSRAITITPAGWLAFRQHLAIDSVLHDSNR
ncbi:helix-turn-helix transcriptional regulator [Advenella sp. FME57]|uniref:ArsR/SmtB family transcription factor n=1 Tax=Advenella sp. FME57 TaxID=2742604 RepID=UPI0018676762|nr:winged helix-turn-helix domain-containing protein [Advenella sp. FME57]